VTPAEWVLLDAARAVALRPPMVAGMYEWSDEQVMIRDAVRQFVDAEIRPNVAALEHGDLAPYDLLRKLFSTFGMDAMARDSFRRRQDATAGGAKVEQAGEGSRGGGAGLMVIPIIELCRVCPGMVTALGVSMGLTAAAIMSRGTPAQQERWALDLLTLDKIGAWAITEPDSGSDAFGGMKTYVKRDGEDYILNGQKTFITNGPYADTIVFICKLDEGNPPEERKVLSFVLEPGHALVEQVRGQVHADEYDLEAAHEQAQRQEHIAAVAERLATRLGHQWQDLTEAGGAQGGNSIVVGAQVVSALQVIVAREVSPFKEAVVTLGSFNAGHTHNVIPDRAIITGTIRAFDSELFDRMEARVVEIVKGVSEALRATATVTCEMRYPPTA